MGGEGWGGVHPLHDGRHPIIESVIATLLRQVLAGTGLGMVIVSRQVHILLLVQGW